MVETVGTAQRIAARAALLRARIDDAARRAGRDPNSVTLIAVTKTMSVETIRAAALAGIRDIGEKGAGSVPQAWRTTRSACVALASDRPFATEQDAPGD